MQTAIPFLTERAIARCFEGGARARRRAARIATAGLVFLLLLGAALARGQDSQGSGDGDVPFDIDFTVPEGFAVEFVDKPDTVGSIVNLSFDAEGRIVYSREDTSLFRLVESGDTLAPEVVTSQVTNSQGFFFDGNELLIVGEGPQGTGLYRIPGATEGRGGEPELLTGTTREIQEHGPHAVMYGPDGYLYWVMGNHTGVDPTEAPLSPHRDYYEGHLLPRYTDPRGHANDIRVPGGTIKRTDLGDSSGHWATVAGGFRNEYDAAFNTLGELFTFDSDMEWDRELPWFRPVQTLHVVPGGEYGWRTGSSKFPSYFPDRLPPLTAVGRGSPTGVSVYKHDAYPERYDEAAFYADWSRGRILVGFQEKSGASYAEETVEFVGGQPLNVTDIAVGPDGNLYFALGGRNTEGGIFRVVYEGEEGREVDAADGAEGDGSPVRRAIAQPHPRSAWGRARIESYRSRMSDSAWAEGLREIARSSDADPMDRVRALELLEVHGPGLQQELLVALGEDEPWQVRAASTYYLGLHEAPAARAELVDRLDDEDDMVKRRAAEALIRSGVHPAVELSFDPVEEVVPLLRSPDRYVRYAARELLERTNRARWEDAVLQLDGYPEATEGLLALVHTAQDFWDTPPLLTRELELLQDEPTDAQLRDLLRVVQLTMDQSYAAFGRTFYSSPGWGSDEPGLYPQIAEILLERYPSGDEGLDTELVRAIAYLEPEGGVAALTGALERRDHGRQYQIHVAYGLRTMEGSEWSSPQKDTVIEWFARAMEEGWNGGASYRGYLQNIWQEFVQEILAPDEREIAQEQVPELSPGFGEEVRPDSLAFRRESYEEPLSRQELFEELVYDPQMHEGDPTAGVQAFEKAFCASCHTMGRFGEGGFGPDLTTVSGRFSRQDMVEAIMYPSRTISDFWQPVRVVTTGGEEYVGTVVDEGANTMTMTLRTKNQVTVDKSNIEERGISETSPMPDHLLYNLDDDEMADLLAFLEAGPDAVPDSVTATGWEPEEEGSPEGGD